MSIEKIQQGEKISQSKDLISDNIDKLKELFPEIISENRIDFKVLRAVLGDEIEEEEEYYRFTWAGKSAARREAHKPTTGTLRPVKEDSVDWDMTQNLYIEGDNLEVLKLLQKSYAGKVKLIYIDPPYNTGNDFVYKDNYKDNLKNYKELTGQIDSSGNILNTNSESDGRFHSNWLNMIYPRLSLARNLLRDDGIIFISIDDNEYENLKKVCNEVFGEYNFLASFIWEKRITRENRKVISVRHDYILSYTKARNDERAIHLLPMDEEAISRYKNPDNDARGVWTSVPAIAQAGHGTKNQFYTLTTPSGRKTDPPSGSCWRYTQKRMNEAIADNRIWFGSDGNGVPRIKKFLNEGQQGLTPESIWWAKDVGTNDTAKRELTKLFNGKAVFETPKPTTLLKRIIQLSTSTDSIVMDFFAGSSPFAHALFEQNLEDGGNRKFIQVQLPEQVDENSVAFKEGYQTISHLGRERIKKAGLQLIKKNIDESKGGMIPFENENNESELKKKAKKIDLGFRVFRLDSSNIKGWSGNPDNLEQSLLDSVTNIKDDRTEEDVLYEILLKYGLDLTLPIEEKVIEDKKVFNVGLGALFLCLGENITSKVAEGIGKWKEELNPELCRVIFKDTGFTDVEKTNSAQTLKRFGIEEIKSI